MWVAEWIVVALLPRLDDEMYPNVSCCNDCLPGQNDKKSPTVSCCKDCGNAPASIGWLKSLPKINMILSKLQSGRQQRKGNFKKTINWFFELEFACYNLGVFQTTKPSSWFIILNKIRWKILSTISVRWKHNRQRLCLSSYFA